MPTAAIPGGPAPFQKSLIGIWSNQAFPNAKNGEGSPSNPLAYNVIGPSANSDTTGQKEPWIYLENCTVNEDVTFDAGTPHNDPLAAPPATYSSESLKQDRAAR